GHDAILSYLSSLSPFLFHPAAAPYLYTLSLHDALPIFLACFDRPADAAAALQVDEWEALGEEVIAHVHHLRLREEDDAVAVGMRSEEHTSELQSLTNLVCRLLLEKKNRSYCCP